MLQNKTRIATVLLFAFVTVSAVHCKTASTSPKGYTITGQIEGLKTDSVFLYNTLTNLKEASPAKNGHFSFTGKVTYPEAYQIYFDREETKYIDLFLENAPVSVKGHVDSLNKIQINGSESNNEMLNYKKGTKAIRSEFNVLDRLLGEATDNGAYQKADSITPLAAAAAHKLLENVYAYAVEHKNSVIVPCLLHNASMNAPDEMLVNKIISIRGAADKKNPRIEAIDKMFAAIKRTAVGSMAPDFEITAQSGKILSPGIYKGKVLLLDFWASWCTPCLKGFPELEEIYKKYKGDKFEIIGLSVDKDKTAWQKAVAKYGLPWPQAAELRGPDAGAPNAYGIIFIPTVYLIDADGKIAGINLHGNKLENKIKELMH